MTTNKTAVQKKTARKKTTRKKYPALKVKARLSQAMIDKIVSFIRAGNYPKIAALLAGASEGGFYKWLKIGRDCIKDGGKPKNQNEALCVVLVESVKEAEAIAEAVHVQQILKASKKTWQASAWYLERKHYDRWGRKERIEHTGPDGEGPQTGVLLVTREKPPIDEWERQAAEQQDLLRGV